MCVLLGGVHESVAVGAVVEEIVIAPGEEGSVTKVRGADWTEAPPAFLDAIRSV